MGKAFEVQEKAAPLQASGDAGAGNGDVLGGGGVARGSVADGDGASGGAEGARFEMIGGPAFGLFGMSSSVATAKYNSSGERQWVKYIPSTYTVSTLQLIFLDVGVETGAGVNLH